jgi:hypothetical protein
MKKQPILEAEPVLQAERPRTAGVKGRAAARRPARPSRHPFVGFLFAVLGWAWRLPACTVLCMTWLGAVLVTGWLYRWMQARALYGWYNSSSVRDETSFEAFCATLGPDAPRLRPRLFLRDRFDKAGIEAEVKRPTADGEPPGWVRLGFRWLLMPFRSLWLNAKVGFLGTLATLLLLGWGATLMTFSWVFGWNNSYFKGYELAAVGPLMGVAGMLLFALAMLYGPLAQVHQAVTGDFRAFFDFRFVWRLIRARLTAYVLLAFFLGGLGVLFEVFKTAPAFLDGQVPYFTNMTDQQILQWLQGYYLIGTFFLILALLATRLVGVWIYRSAVLKVLHRGRVSREQLHPVLAEWLGKLDLFPRVEPVARPGVRQARAFGRWLYRRAAFAVLFLVWVGFVARAYVGEFFNYHPVVPEAVRPDTNPDFYVRAFFSDIAGAGFLNHPLIHVPCCNYIPQQLKDAAKR